MSFFSSQFSSAQNTCAGAPALVPPLFPPVSAWGEPQVPVAAGIDQAGASQGEDVPVDYFSE